MAQQVFPTKGNLIATKKTLELSRMGFSLMDRKRNILIREMMLMVDKSKMLRNEIDAVYTEAYKALEHANITMGEVTDIVKAVPLDDNVEISYRSVMGVDIPNVKWEEQKVEGVSYGFIHSNSALDEAFCKFQDVKRMTALLAEIENSVFRLANAIIKTQRRANALENVVIPQYEGIVKFITDALDEKDREEFSRLKVIKRTKLKKETENA